MQQGEKGYNFTEESDEDVVSIELQSNGSKPSEPEPVPTEGGKRDFTLPMITCKLNILGYSNLIFQTFHYANQRPVQEGLLFAIANRKHLIRIDTNTGKVSADVMEINIPATKKPPVLYHWQDALFFVGIVGGFFGFNIKTKTKFFENIEDDAVNNPVWCIDENNKLYLTYGYTIKRIDLLTGKVELGTSLSSMGDVQSLHCKDGTIYASSSALSALNFETHKHTVICDKCSSFLFYKDSIITHYSWAGNDLTRRIDFQTQKVIWEYKGAGRTYVLADRIFGTHEGNCTKINYDTGKLEYTLNTFTKQDTGTQALWLGNRLSFPDPGGSALNIASMVTSNFTATSNLPKAFQLEVRANRILLQYEDSLLLLDLETHGILQQWKNVTSFGLNNVDEFFCITEGRLEKFSLETNETLLQFAGDKVYAHTILFSEDDEYLFTNNSHLGGPTQWDARTGNVVRHWKGDHSKIAYNEKILYIYNFDSVLERFDTETGEMLKPFKTDKIYAVKEMLCWNSYLFVVYGTGYVARLTIRGENVLPEVYQYSESAMECPIVIHRDLLYIKTRTCVAIFDLKLNKHIKNIALTISNFSCMAVTDTRIVLSANGYLTNYDLVFAELPDPWLNALKTPETLVTLLKTEKDNILKWRHSTGHSFATLCIPYLFPESVALVYSQFKEDHFRQPNQEGQYGFLLIYASNNYYHLKNHYAELERSYTPSELQITASAEFLFKHIKWTREFDLWRVQDRMKHWIGLQGAKRVIWHISLKLIYSNPQPVLEYFEIVKQFDDIGPNTLTLFGEACSRRMPALVQQLLQRDEVNAGIRNFEGQSMLHSCLQLPEFTSKQTEFKDDNVRVHYGFIRDGIECAKILLHPVSASKRPSLFSPDQKGITCYDQALLIYDFTFASMKRPRDELQDRDGIKCSKDLYRMSNDLIADIHGSYTQTGSKRQQFALKMFLKNSIFYTCFLLLLTSMAFVNTTNNDPSTYLFKQTLHSNILDSNGKTFESISSASEIYNWLETVLLPAIYATSDDSTNYNQFIGKVRLKTIQVKDNSCSSSMKGQIPFCYTHALHISKDPYGPWNYLDDSEETGFNSPLSHQKYPPGGFVVDLSMSSYNESLEQIQSLRSGQWINLNTRVAVASMTLVNPNLNKLGTIRAIFEFDVSGNIYTSAEIYQTYINPYQSSYGFLVLELLCLLYILVEFLVREIVELRMAGKFVTGYIYEFWNLYEWVIIAFTIVIVIIRIYIAASLANIDFVLVSPYINFQRLTDLKHSENALLSLLLVMCWLRGLKLLRIPPFTGPVTLSIMETVRARTFVVFIAVFVLVVFSFSIGFSVAFGNNLSEFQTMGDSFMTMIKMAFGDFSTFDEMSQDNYILAPFIFIAFVFFVSLILLNLVVAILSEVYIAIQRHNEAVWDRFITRMWIRELQQSNSIWNKYTSAAINLLKAPFSKTVVANERESRQFILEYDEGELDDMADKFEEDRTQKSSKDIWETMQGMNAQLNQIQQAIKKLESNNTDQNKD